MHNVIVFGAVGLVLVASGSSFADGDAAAGKRKTATCQGCHGIAGYKTAFPAVYSVPKLGGQHAGYLVKALQAYKSGARKNAIMAGQAAS